MYITIYYCISGRTSIPIHCIVERISSPGSTGCTAGGSSGGSNITQQQSSTTTTQQSPSSIASSNVDSSSSANLTCSSASVIEQDSFAIISSGVLFTDLVRTALLRLGYSPAEAVGAKGGCDLEINMSIMHSFLFYAIIKKQCYVKHSLYPILFCSNLVNLFP